MFPKTMTRNDFGKIWLVEECQKIEMRTLLQQAKKQVKGILLQSVADINGIQVNIISSPISNGGNRYWFQCPICKQRKSVLFVHPLNQQTACRKCLQLRYRKSMKKGMVENEISI